MFPIVVALAIGPSILQWREEDMKSNGRKGAHRRDFIGGSDARIIMGDEEAALDRLWREKRGEVSRPT